MTLAARPAFHAGARRSFHPARPAACSIAGALLVLGVSDVLGVRVTPKLVAGGDVGPWELTQDGKRVIYLADQETDERQQLYGVPANGDLEALALTDPLPLGRAITGLFRLTPDGGRAVYRADRDFDDRFELYSVPTDGSRATVKLSGTLIPQGDVSQFQLTGDGKRVVYSADAFQDGVVHIFCVPVDGSLPPVKLATMFPFGQFQLTPDGSRVVFLGGNSFSPSLFSAGTDGSGTPTLLPGSPLGEFPLSEFEISSDGKRVVYRGRIPAGNFYDYVICSVPVGGGAPAVSLFDVVPEGKIPSEPEFGISPDSRWVVHRSEPDLLASHPYELLSAPIDGSSPPVRLDPDLTPDPGAGPFLFSRYGTHVVFNFDFAIGSTVSRRLYGVPVDGSTEPMALSGGLIPRRLGVIDQERVVFESNSATGHRELYSVRFDGSAAPVRLTGPMVAGGNVVDTGASNLLGPDGRTVIYLADQDVDEQVELYVVPLDGSRPARKINGPLAGGGDVFLPRFRPDSRVVLYSADQEQDGVFELFLSSIAERRAPTARR